MSWYWWLGISFAVPFLVAFIDLAWKDYQRTSSWEKVERVVAEQGLPPATHRKRRRFRTVELASFDEKGEWKWRARYEAPVLKEEEKGE
jgi:hypothetical protein